MEVSWLWLVIIGTARGQAGQKLLNVDDLPDTAKTKNPTGMNNLYRAGVFEK